MIGLFTRSFFFYSYFEFKNDQARESYVMLEMQNGNFPITGPASSVENFSLPPYYYYLLYPFIFISKEPQYHVIANAIFSWASIILIYVFFKKHIKTQFQIVNNITPALLALLWSIFIPDIEISTKVWNPGPMTFFILCYLLLFNSIEQELDKGKINIIKSIGLGVIIMVISSLHSIGLILIPTITTIIYFWKYLTGSFEKPRIQSFLITVIIYLLLLIPYLFSEKNIINVFLTKSVVKYPILYPLTIILIILGIGALLLIWKFKNKLKKQIFQQKILTILHFAFAALLLIVLYLNPQGFTYYLYRLITAGFIFNSNPTIVTIAGLISIVAICFWTYRLKKSNILAFISYFILIAFLFFSQLFTQSFYRHYTAIIWIPLLYLCLFFTSTLKQKYQKLLLTFLGVFYIFSLFSNSYNLHKYFTNFMFGNERLINTKDISEAIASIPSGSTINFDKQTEYELTYKYIAENINEKSLTISQTCQTNCYVIYPKYIPDIGFNIKQNQIDYQGYTVVQDNQIYSILFKP